MTHLSKASKSSFSDGLYFVSFKFFKAVFFRFTELSRFPRVIAGDSRIFGWRFGSNAGDLPVPHTMKKILIFHFLD